MREEEHVVISSLIVECLPEDMDGVAGALASHEGVEVHGMEAGQVVITIERPTLDESHDLANAITQLDRVTGLSLIYANFEDDPDLNEMQRRLADRAKSGESHG